MSDEPADHPPPEVLREFAEGRLEPNHAGAVERHLLACEGCCLAIEAGPEDELVGRLRRAGVGAADPDGPPPGTRCSGNSAGARWGSSTGPGRWP